MLKNCFFFRCRPDLAHITSSFLVNCFKNIFYFIVIAMSYCVDLLLFRFLIAHNCIDRIFHSFFHFIITYSFHYFLFISFSFHTREYMCLCAIIIYFLLFFLLLFYFCCNWFFLLTIKIPAINSAEANKSNMDIMT